VKPSAVEVGVPNDGVKAAIALIVKERDSCVAAAYVVFPAWSAVNVQVPAATIVTVVPETVQTEVVVDAKVTVREELAVAEIENAESPKVLEVGAVKVIV
jgi:hypothetical protein